MFLLILMVYIACFCYYIVVVAQSICSTAGYNIQLGLKRGV
jgi:hypothetical protein